jgi:hypothetical protein
MECLDDQSQRSHDSVPYANLAVTGQTYDLSAVVPAIQGLAFDSRENLWVWTGESLVPLRPRYDGYILDATTRTLYVTDAFDAVRYE